LEPFQRSIFGFADARRRLLRGCDIVDGCWVWQGARRNGYGTISVFGRTRTVHRVSYVLFVGSVELGQSVLHTCGNSLCCCPDHLYIDIQEKPLSMTAASSWQS